MEKAFHLAHRIFFDLFRRLPAFKPQLGADQHGDQLSRPCLMCRTYRAVRFEDSRVSGSAAHIQDGQRKPGARGGHRSEGCHDSLHACNDSLDMKFFLQSFRYLLHGQMSGPYHGRYADRFLHAGLACKSTGDRHGRKGIDCQNIRDPDLFSAVSGHIRHAGSDPFKHVSDIGIVLSFNVPDLSGRGTFLHDPVGTGVDVDGSVRISVKGDLSCRQHIFLYIAVRSPYHHSTPVSDQALCDGRHHSGFVRVKSEKGRDPIGIRKHPDRSTRKRHLNGSHLAFRYLPDVPDFVHDGDPDRKAVFHKHCFVRLKDQTFDIQLRDKLVQPRGSLLVGESAVYGNNIGDSRLSPPQVFQKDQFTDRFPCACRRGRIVTDHGGFRDDRLCYGLHRGVSDDRSRFIQTHQRKGGQWKIHCTECIQQGLLYAEYVRQRPLGARSHAGCPGDKPKRPVFTDLPDTDLCCRISDINARDQFQARIPLFSYTSAASRTSFAQCGA